MKVPAIVFLLVAFFACQPKKQYDDSAFDELSKRNRTINPYGTYSNFQAVSDYKKVILLVDSHQCRLLYKDSQDQTRTVSGKWLTHTFDTQLFSFDPPFDKGLFAAEGIYFLDSAEHRFLDKVAETISLVHSSDTLRNTP